MTPSRVALALLVLLGCRLAAGCWSIYSPTWDEPEHLAAGIELLDKGRYEYDTEHPPLGRLLLALGPYLAGARSFGTPPPDGTQEGKDILDSSPRPGEYLSLARMGTLPFLALLLFATWLWGRRVLGSETAALLPVALLVSVPPILGHAALASLDVAAAATALLALYALQVWLDSGRPRAGALFGLASGVAVGTKFSAVPFLALALPALALVRARLGPPPLAAGAGARRWLAGLGWAALGALLVLWLTYAPRSADSSGVEVRFDWAVNYLLVQGGFDHTLGVWLSHLWLPREAKDLVNGIMAVKAHNDTGHRAYLLGEVSLHGWWYFYLVALAVKTPLPLLAAGLPGLILLARQGWRERRPAQLAPPVLFLVLLAFASLFSRINIGIRHVLILYPLLTLGAAFLVLRAARAITQARMLLTRRLGTALLAALLVWQFSVLWRAYPDYLPYFNETVREPRKVLVDSDLDWGQDLKRLELRAAELRIPHLWLAYQGTVDLAREPLPPFDRAPPRQPVRGWLAVSALARTRRLSDYAWVDSYPPLERIGSSIELYYIP
ncbi:MAG: glycosyltransferase family 39 protein [Gammaproteobacteria bacterium]|nr:glycosyltransferase family 39 protein [Gammaproteobacteria bacterium]MBV9696542.1 glycosyltransferase family 39 protein [Gammaproteobacteria bacterium]